MFLQILHGGLQMHQVDIWQAPGQVDTPMSYRYFHVSEGNLTQKFVT